MSTSDSKDKKPSKVDGRSTPQRKYESHKRGAANRGLAFTLTFEQWWTLWEPYWDRRGTKAQDMCMCRTGDKGGYELGNVRIATVLENRQEWSLEYRTAHAQRVVRRREYRKPVLECQASWVSNRRAFDEYVEEDEEGY